MSTVAVDKSIFPQHTGWTFQRVTINNCEVGFDLKTGGHTAATQVNIVHFHAPPGFRFTLFSRP